MIKIEVSQEEWELILLAVGEWREEYATVRQDAVLAKMLKRVTPPPCCPHSVEEDLNVLQPGGM